MISRSSTRKTLAAWMLPAGVILIGSPLPLSAQPLPQVAEHMEVVKAAEAVALKNARSSHERGVIAADLSFAADAQRMHVAEAFKARIAPDAVLIGPGDPVVVGADAVVAEMRKSKAAWYWSPLGARVDGKLGVTWGVAAIVYRNAEGRQASIQTRYVTSWRRLNNQWKIWLDTGNVGPASMAFVKGLATEPKNR